MCTACFLPCWYQELLGPGGVRRPSGKGTHELPCPELCALLIPRSHPLPLEAQSRLCLHSHPPKDAPLSTDTSSPLPFCLRRLLSCEQNCLISTRMVYGVCVWCVCNTSLGVFPRIRGFRAPQPQQETTEAGCHAPLHPQMSWRLLLVPLLWTQPGLV